LTASGTGTTLDLGDGLGTLYYSHLNGTGTITTQGSMVVEGRTEGGTLWFDVQLIGFGTTASQQLEDAIVLPPDLAEVRCVYTAPTGSTGHTLDYEVGILSQS
jgi:hypothetical protein